MLFETQTPVAGPAVPLFDNEAAVLDHGRWDTPAATGHQATTANGHDTDRVVLRRGAEMMVLFRGSPCPTAVGPLRQAGVKFGLALSSGELPEVRGFNDYDYVFVSLRRRARSTLAEAVADLEGKRWSIDESPE